MALDNFQQLPTGAGRRELRKEDLVAVEQVANEVIWVNQDFDVPFLDIRLGEQTKLAVFAGEVRNSKGTLMDERLVVEGSLGHKRSLIVGHQILKDRQGRLYRTLDCKGNGHVYAVEGVLAAR